MNSTSTAETHTSTYIFTHTNTQLYTNAVLEQAAKGALQLQRARKEEARRADEQLQAHRRGGLIGHVVHNRLENVRRLVELLAKLAHNPDQG